MEISVTSNTELCTLTKQYLAHAKCSCFNTQQKDSSTPNPIISFFVGKMTKLG